METIIQKILKLLLDKFGAEYDVITIHEENGHYRANVETSTAGSLIGKNGIILNSLEHFFKEVLYKQSDEKVFVTLDVDNYKKEKQDKVLGKVQQRIDYMKDTNVGEMKLWPMHPGLRRIVHLWVATSYPELTTDSVGDGSNRSIRVLYK
jgi:predicted RNA-binding protein Jag